MYTRKRRMTSQTSITYNVMLKRRHSCAVTSSISFVLFGKTVTPHPKDEALLLFGGECGIRTHVTLPSNGFQDRLVMTASITLHFLSGSSFLCRPIIIYLFSFLGKTAV